MNQRRLLIADVFHFKHPVEKYSKKHHKLTKYSAKIRPDLFSKNSILGLIYCDQELLWLLNVIEDDCYFLGVYIRLSIRCKIFFHSKIT